MKSLKVIILLIMLLGTAKFNAKDAPRLTLVNLTKNNVIFEIRTNLHCKIITREIKGAHQAIIFLENLAQSQAVLDHKQSITKQCPNNCTGCTPTVVTSVIAYTKDKNGRNVVVATNYQHGCGTECQMRSCLDFANWGISSGETTPTFEQVCGTENITVILSPAGSSTGSSSANTVTAQNIGSILDPANKPRVYDPPYLKTKNA